MRLFINFLDYLRLALLILRYDGSRIIVKRNLKGVTYFERKILQIYGRQIWQ